MSTGREAIVRLVLADDDSLIREGIRALLGEAPDIQILGEAQDGSQAQQLTAQLRPGRPSQPDKHRSHRRSSPRPSSLDNASTRTAPRRAEVGRAFANRAAPRAGRGGPAIVAPA